VSVLSQIST